MNHTPEAKLGVQSRIVSTTVYRGKYIMAVK